jgi:L-ascorbate metabolism protein UlaG (beta-lactamase superfamily)
LLKETAMTVIFKFVGHSTFTVDVDGIKLILDPFLAPHNPMASLTAGDVDADFMLISHGHQDHICDAAAVAKRTGALVISNAEIITWLRNQGVENGHAMNTGGAYSFPFGRVKMTVAHHSSRLPDGCNGGNPVGLLLQFNDGHDVYFAGDTALTYDMKLIGESGGVDLALLPIGDNFTMGPEDAIQAASLVKAKHVVPMHYNTFPVIEQDPEAFATALREVTAIDCTVLAPGEELILD